MSQLQSERLHTHHALYIGTGSLGLQLGATTFSCRHALELRKNTHTLPAHTGQPARHQETKNSQPTLSRTPRKKMAKVASRCSGVAQHM